MHSELGPTAMTTATTQVGVIKGDHLAEVLIEITNTLVDDVDPIEFLRLVTSRTAAMSQSLWASVVLADAEGRLQLAAASSESAALIDLFRLDVGDGPWLDCFRTGSPVVNTDLTQAQARWPVLAPRALDSGFRWVSTFPLRGRTGVIGALNLFSTDPAHLEPQDVRILQSLADVATIGLLHQRSPHEEVLAATRLHRSLTDRIAGEQAKGALASTQNVSIEAASDLIADYAHRTDQHPVTVAEAVLANPDLIAPADPRTLLTPAEVAAMFRVDPKTITRWATIGQLTAVRTLGGHRRYRLSEVTRLLTQG